MDDKLAELLLPHMYVASYSRTHREGKSLIKFLERGNFLRVVAERKNLNIVQLLQQLHGKEPSPTQTKQAEQTASPDLLALENGFLCCKSPGVKVLNCLMLLQTWLNIV